MLKNVPVVVLVYSSLHTLHHDFAVFLVIHLQRYLFYIIQNMGSLFGKALNAKLHNPVCEIAH